MRLPLKSHSSRARLGICLVLLLASCAGPRQTAAPPVALRATITLAPGQAEADLMTLQAAVSFRSNFSIVNADASQPSRYQLDFRSEQAFRIFMEQARQLGLPLLAVHTERIGY